MHNNITIKSMFKLKIISYIFLYIILYPTINACQLSHRKIMAYQETINAELDDLLKHGPTVICSEQELINLKVENQEILQAIEKSNNSDNLFILSQINEKQNSIKKKIDRVFPWQ